MSPSILNELMLKVPQADKYTWAMLYSKRNVYGLQNMTKEEWETWVKENPRGALTSKEPAGEISSVSNKHIGIKREPKFPRKDNHKGSQEYDRHHF